MAMPAVMASMPAVMSGVRFIVVWFIVGKRGERTAWMDERVGGVRLIAERDDPPKNWTAARAGQ